MKHQTLFILLHCLILGSACSKVNQKPKSIGSLSWEVLTPLNSEIPSNFITTIQIDKNDNIWIGTFGNGIGFYNGESWQNYNTKNSGISNDTIHDIKIDSAGSIWVATQFGLSKLYKNEWQIFNTSNSVLPDNIINCLEIDKLNNIWIGCASSINGGLIKINKNNWQIFNTNNSVLPCNSVVDIYSDKDNIVWIATNQHQGYGGIVKISNSEWYTLTMSNTKIKYNNASRIIQDGNNNIWISQAALFYDTEIYDGDILKIKNEIIDIIYPHDINLLLSNRVRSFAIDNYGYLWLSTMPETGIDKHEVAIYNGINFRTISELDSNFGHYLVLDMAFDNKNQLWICQAGLGLTKVTVEYE